MIKVDQSNMKQAKQFVIENLKRSGFTYGNLTHPQAVSYLNIKNEQIVAMTNCLSSKYVTYLFPENTTDEVVIETIEYMQDKPHIGGTVTGDYYDIFNKYYSMPSNAVNEVATFELKHKPNYNFGQVERLTIEEAINYKQSIDRIKEFPIRSLESIKEAFERNYVVGIKEDDKILSAATLTSISDKTAVVVSVFTVPEAEGKGYATKCISKLLNEYAENRTILIFFSNPIAKKVYLNLGFEVDDTLLMYDNKQ